MSPPPAHCLRPVDRIVVSDRSFESQPEPPLLRGAVGDVCAARRVALELLRPESAQLVDVTLATLVLSAILLHVSVNAGGEVHRRDLVVSLSALRDAGVAALGLQRSPMHFVRYASAEFQDLGPPRRYHLVELLLCVAEDSSPSGSAGSDPLHSSSNGP